jgi:hypothetical protein
MKHAILFMGAFSILLSTGVSAQSDDMREKFVVGAKIGLNRSNVYDKQGENFTADPKLGFAGGGFIDIPLGKYIGLQPEILFSQKGYAGQGTYVGGDYSYTRTTNYMDIPLQIQLKPSKYFALLVGPQYSYLLSIRDVYQAGNASTVSQQNIDNDNARKNILGATVGFDITVHYFVFSARACWDLENNNGDGTTTVSRYRNTWMQATVGVRF